MTWLYRITPEVLMMTTMKKWEARQMMRMKMMTMTLETSEPINVQRSPASVLIFSRLLRYSDDDDTSWKVRRASTKLLSACISTRSDLLASFYRIVSPALISRFSEREETVKVEVWATYTALLTQTKVFGASGSTSDREGSPSGSLKRKRSVDEMIVEEG
jgi:hypothetical protein